MKVKLLIRLFIFLWFNTVFSQETVSQKLEQLADSLYYNKSEYYKEKDFLKLQQLRNTIISKYTNKTSIPYKISLSKKLAADALFLTYENEFDAAIILSKKAIKSYNNIGIKNLYYKGHLHKYLSEQYYYAKDYDNALLQAKETRNIFKDTLVYNHRLVAEAEFQIGSVLGIFEDYDKIIAQYKKAVALNISEKGEYTVDAAIHEHHLALIYGFVGFYQKELESYLKVVKRWEAIQGDDKDMSALAIAYGSLKTWYLQHGDFETAEQYFIKKEHLVKRYMKNGNKWSQEAFKGRTKVISWQNYTSLYFYKKDTIKAMEYNKKVLDFIADFDFNDKRNNPYNIVDYKHFVMLNYISALGFKAKIIQNDDPKQAEFLYEKALSLEDKDNVSRFTLKTKLSLLKLYTNGENYYKAHKKLNLWLRDAKKRNANYVSMLLLAEKANLAYRQDSISLMHNDYKLAFKKALKDTTQHISLQRLKNNDCKPFSDNRFIDFVIKAGDNFNKAYKKTKNKVYLKIAHNLNLLASEIFAVNYTVLNYNDKTYNTAILINEQLLSTTLNLNNKTIFDNVLQKIEESSSKLSWHKFLNSNQRKYINIPDSILTKESELKAQLHFYKKSLFLNADSNAEKVTMWKEKIFDLENEIKQLNAWLQKEYASYFNQTQKEFSIDEIKQKLQSNQKIIKYIFAKKNVYAFTITKSSTQLTKIASKDTLTANLNPLIKGLPKSSTTDYKNVASALYNVLLPTQILESTDTKDLIFILDDILYYVPMEILTDSNGKYLIENHSVSYASSLLLWNEQLQVEKSKINKFGIYSPVYKKKNINPKRGDNSELLGATEEALQISKLFNADLFLGNQANKKAFLNDANDYNVLHLAMHSNINNTDSEFSNLLFSDDHDDGKLFISELYSIQLNADLVVLSACNTAIGTLKRGEGLVNVSKAFTYAGVPSTVTSLWKVPDKETSKIMISFYQYLKEGKPKNKALQLAKLDYLQNTTDQTLKHPYYWAGFVVSGDTSPIIKPISYGKYALGISAFFLGIFFLRKKYVNIH